MYQVLYRKWRSRAFSDLIGQPHITLTLQNEIALNRISHAYLFTGSRGTGKTSCAKIFAKAINCLHPNEGSPCGVCDICKGIDNGSLMDVVEIDAASNNGVENIRTLREEVNFTPAITKYRVYIIDEVHMLSIGAFNALLKTLEEPPYYVVFILATTEAHKLPPTILSRCQRFDFHRIAAKDIAARLIYIAKQESADLHFDAALLIARLADGSLRDALSILDQCMDSKITLEKIKKNVGLVGKEQIISFTNLIQEKNTPTILEELDEIYNKSKDLLRFCAELAMHFRNLMLIKLMGKSANEILLFLSEEYLIFEQQAELFSLTELLHVLDLLQNCIQKMQRSPNKRFDMEMCMIRLCNPELDVSTTALLQRIVNLESRFSLPNTQIESKSSHIKGTNPSKKSNEFGLPWNQNSFSSFADRPAKKVVRLPVNTKLGNSSMHMDILQENIQAEAKKMKEWPEILQIMKAYSPTIAAAFTSSIAYISGDYVLIDAPNSMAFDLFRKSSQRDKMRDAIKQTTGKIYKLGPYKKEENKAKDPLLLESPQEDKSDIKEKNINQ